MPTKGSKLGKNSLFSTSAAAVPCVRDNLNANGWLDRARIEPVALADHVGTATLRHTDEGTWGASLFEEDGALLRTETVQLRPLSEILGDARPQIVKCNAEGAEYALMAQIAASDWRPDLVIMMVHPEFGDMDALLDRAHSCGYETHRTGTEHRPAFQMWHRIPTP